MKDVTIIGWLFLIPFTGCMVWMVGSMFYYFFLPVGIFFIYSIMVILYGIIRYSFILSLIALEYIYKKCKNGIKKILKLTKIIS